MINAEEWDFTWVERVMMMEGNVLNQMSLLPTKEFQVVWFGKSKCKYEIEVSILVTDSELMAMASMTNNPAMFALKKLESLNSNLGIIPFGYYFDWGKESDIYYFGKNKLRKVKSVLLFFGTDDKSDLKKFKKGNFTRAKTRILSVKRKARHGINDRGALPYSIEAMSEPKKKKKIESEKTQVPDSLRKTDRTDADHVYVFEERKSYPIGDLYHARSAVLRAMSPSGKKNAKAVLKAVSNLWSQYDWESFWNKKRKKSKNKSKLKTFKGIMR